MAKQVGKEELVRDFKRVDQMFDHSITKREYDEHGEFCAATVTKHLGYGNWENAKWLHGLEQGPKWWRTRKRFCNEVISEVYDFIDTVEMPHDVREVEEIVYEMTDVESARQFTQYKQETISAVVYTIAKRHDFLLYTSELPGNRRKINKIHRQISNTIGDDLSPFSKEAYLSRMTQLLKVGEFISDELYKRGKRLLPHIDTESAAKRKSVVAGVILLAAESASIKVRQEDIPDTTSQTARRGQRYVIDQLGRDTVDDLLSEHNE